MVTMVELLSFMVRMGSGEPAAGNMAAKRPAAKTSDGKHGFLMRIFIGPMI
jgi:hypothetical protein